jgi:hypothetical protein
MNSKIEAGKDSQVTEPVKRDKTDFPQSSWRLERALS